MKFKSDKEEIVIQRLIAKNRIPLNGSFEITENLIDEYISEYESRFSKGNKKHSVAYARKLAGLTFVRLNSYRGATFKDIKAGIVYVISNPAWPDHLKVGMTLDIVNRLGQYQVYDPFKKFKVEHYEFVMDRKRTEDNMIRTFSFHLESGEWLKFNDAKKIIDCVRTNNWKI